MENVIFLIEFVERMMADMRANEKKQKALYNKKSIREASASYLLKELANPKCQGSERVLNIILQHRNYKNEEESIK